MAVYFLPVLWREHLVFAAAYDLPDAKSEILFILPHHGIRPLTGIDNFGLFLFESHQKRIILLPGKSMGSDLAFMHVLKFKI
jgi:hypothetical protein